MWYKNIIFLIYKIFYKFYCTNKFCYEEIVHIFINRNKQFIINSTQVILYLNNFLFNWSIQI